VKVLKRIIEKGMQPYAPMSVATIVKLSEGYTLDDINEKVTEAKFLLYIYLHCTYMYNGLITHMFR
jgi:hypothetical protein